MKIVLPTAGNISNLMRQCGYFFDQKKADEMVFIRIIGNAKSGYPRFHAYVTTDHVSRQTSINLHLDQKKPIYHKVAAHSAEYESSVVKGEEERIKQILGL